MGRLSNCGIARSSEHRPFGLVGGCMDPWELECYRGAQSRLGLPLCFFLQRGCREASGHILSPSSVRPPPWYLVAVEFSPLS